MDNTLDDVVQTDEDEKRRELFRTDENRDLMFSFWDQRNPKSSQVVILHYGGVDSEFLGFPQT